MRIITLIVTMLISNAVYAQIIPVEELYPNYFVADNLIPPNASFSDTNNIFDRFKGKWSYIDPNNSKKYIFKLGQKRFAINEEYGTYIEILTFKYKVEDSNGNILVDYICNGGICAQSPTKLNFGYLINENRYSARLSEYVSCDRLGNLHINSFDNGNKLKFELHLLPIFGRTEDEYTPDKCEDNVTPFPIPVGEITLERIE